MLVERLLAQHFNPKRLILFIPPTHPTPFSFVIIFCSSFFSEDIFKKNKWMSFYIIRYKALLFSDFSCVFTSLHICPPPLPPHASNVQHGFL